MAPRERRPVAKTPYPESELPDGAEVDLEHSAANVHLEDGPAALSRHSLNRSYPKGADARERFRHMLRVYSFHTVKPYEQDAWRVVSQEGVTAVPPLQPVNSRYELTYRKCFNTQRSKRGWCCVNECAQFCNSRYMCKFCYPVEHPLYDRSFADELAPPCRCSCDVYRHDVMWTSVGQGTFHYQSPNARMCSFIDSSGRTRMPLSKVTWLVEDGFAMVPANKSVRCHACLFTEEAGAVFSRKQVNRAHGKYSPFCAFVSRPFDTEIITSVSHMLYHRSFMSLRAIRYVPDENCECYDVRIHFWKVVYSAEGEDE